MGHKSASGVFLFLWIDTIFIEHKTLTASSSLNQKTISSNLENKKSFGYLVRMTMLTTRA